VVHQPRTARARSVGRAGAAAGRGRVSGRAASGRPARVASRDATGVRVRSRRMLPSRQTRSWRPARRRRARSRRLPRRPALRSRPARHRHVSRSPRPRPSRRARPCRPAVRTHRPRPHSRPHPSRPARRSRRVPRRRRSRSRRWRTIPPYRLRRPPTPELFHPNGGIDPCAMRFTTGADPIHGPRSQNSRLERHTAVRRPDGKAHDSRSGRPGRLSCFLDRPKGVV